MNTILVVEDEPQSLKVLSYFLTHEGYYVMGANDGLEALQLLSQFRFDLVLSDLKMPRMDGIALARHIISTVRTPILLMTGYEFDDLKSIQEFAVPCLTKPLSLHELLLTVHKVLGGSGTA
jgi:CheY-like chemotaxis protein